MSSAKPQGQGTGIRARWRKWLAAVELRRFGAVTFTVVVALFAIAIIAVVRGYTWLTVTALTCAVVTGRYYGLTLVTLWHERDELCPCIVRAYRRAYWRHTVWLCVVFVTGVVCHWGASAGWPGVLAFLTVYIASQGLSPWKLSSMLKTRLLAHHVVSVLGMFPHALPLAAVHPGRHAVSDMRMRIVLTNLIAFGAVEVFRAGDVTYIRLLDERAEHT